MIDLSMLVTVAVPTGAGLIAWGTLKQRVEGVEKDVDEKASKEVVDAHFDAVIERLERMERKLDRNTGEG